MLPLGAASHACFVRLSPSQSLIQPPSRLTHALAFPDRRGLMHLMQPSPSVSGITLVEFMAMSVRKSSLTVHLLNNAVDIPVLYIN